MELPSIDKIFDAAHRVGMVHFPNALVIARAHGKWTVTLMKESGEQASGLSPNGKGATAEEAFTDLLASIAKRADEKRRSGQRAIDEADEVLTALATGATP